MNKSHWRRVAVSLAVLAALLIVAGSAPSPNGFTSALGQTSLIPFGGQLLTVTYCCNGIKLTVGPPNGGDFLFTASSKLYAFYQIFAPGPWVLGNAFSGGFCEDISLWCLPTSVDGIIFQIGTSMR